MPVTFPVSLVTTNEMRSHSRGCSPLELLKAAHKEHAYSTKKYTLLQSSVTKEEQPRLEAESNGFVFTVLRAYGSHHHLVIRPDDVWVAILTQFSFYVNAHAEELRAYFVAHEGKQGLTVNAKVKNGEIDFGQFARDMTLQIHKNVVDSTLAEWILPDFTTTTEKDMTICSVLMMATLKEYFDYYCGITCGIPTVTLEGTRDDWVRIVKRLDRLYDFGDETSGWANMLQPILRRFVSAFDGEPDFEFWNHVVYRQQAYCGQDDLNGWITAFCVWTNKGKWNPALAPQLQVPPPRPILEVPRASPIQPPSSSRRLSLKKILSSPFKKRTESVQIAPDTENPTSGGAVTTTTEAMESITTLATTDIKESTTTLATTDATASTTTLTSTAVETESSSKSILEIGQWSVAYMLDGVRYFTIPVQNIPPGYCEVDVTILDNFTEIPCGMVAGHVASFATAKEPGGPLNTLAPAPQWFMYKK
ncbi:hypothetical protein C2E23DRAFT_883330 [Lenzites betulinus]|nr:hypothetical protein C2E23DRAFT_883330 [Lenzites betulinus]